MKSVQDWGWSSWEEELNPSLFLYSREDDNCPYFSKLTQNKRSFLSSFPFQKHSARSQKGGLGFHGVSLAKHWPHQSPFSLCPACGVCICLPYKALSFLSFGDLPAAVRLALPLSTVLNPPGTENDSLTSPRQSQGTLASDPYSFSIGVACRE